MLTARDYQNAIDSQSACNSIALVNSLAEVFPRIKAQCGGMTEKANQHPIVRLYVEQLLFLAGGDATYSSAYQACNMGARGQAKDIEQPQEQRS